MAKAKNVAKKVTKKDVGRYVRVGFTDTGALDGIITAVSGPNDFGILPFRSTGIINNNDAPILALGAHITAEHSGLLG